MKRVFVLSLSIGLGCGHDGGDESGAGSSTGGDSFTSGHSHSSSDPSAVSLTFTNTGDPTDDPSADPTTATTSDPSDATTGDASADSSDGGHGTHASESSGAPEGSSGAAESSDGGSESGSRSSACCEAQDGPGCGDDDIESCVCASESFCCEVEWDLYCTVQVVLLACEVCPGIGGDGDCCAAHDNPGCDDDVIEACVCEQDLACCTEAWDELCVDELANGCGRC